MLTKKFVKRSFTFKFYVKVWSCNRPFRVLLKFTSSPNFIRIGLVLLKFASSSNFIRIDLRGNYTIKLLHETKLETASQTFW